MKKIFEVQKPIIGMIHLKPLPGSPNYDKNKFDMNAIVKAPVDTGFTGYFRPDHRRNRI